MRVAPGDPITAALGGRLPQAELEERRRHDAGYDRPLVTQYLEYLRQVATLDLGTTIIDHRPITEVIVQNGAATLELTLTAMGIAVGVGVPLGVLAGRFRDRPLDVGSRLFADRDLRRTGVLPRLPCPARVREVAELAADLGARQPARHVRAPKPTRTCS